MKGNKTYRHSTNPIEKEIHNKFIEEHGKTMSRITFEPSGDAFDRPSEYLTPREEKIVISAMQWLGSHVGQGFLRECGFERIEK